MTQGMDYEFDNMLKDVLNDVKKATIHTPPNNIFRPPPGMPKRHFRCSPARYPP